MTISTISSSSISSLAISGLNNVTREISDSTYRLASGSRFANAGDDVGALGVSTRINAQRIALTQAQTNNTLADSLLQTAYSAASEIYNILDEMNTLAVSASSGALTAVDRALLDLEFQELMAEIDSIAESTNFNDIALLNGSVSGEGEITGSEEDATKASATLTFTGVFGAGSTIRINGTSFTGATFGVGASATASATNLYTYLSTSTDANLRQLEYSLLGTTVSVTSRAGGKQGEHILIEESHANLTVSGQATSNANITRLNGGEDDGLFKGAVRVSGTIGDSLVSSLTQTQGTSTLTIVNNALLSDLAILLYFDNGVTDAGLRFQGRTSATTATNQFMLGANAEETLQNLVAAMEAYSGTSDSSLKQLEFEIDGDNLYIRSALPLDAKRLDGTTDIYIISGVATNRATFTGSGTGALVGGASTGIVTDGIMNPDFIGTGISGFSATYVSADRVTASITVGDDTYSATITDTTPATSTRVTFASTSGGYFQLDLASGGLSVSDQDDANTYAGRLDAAISGLTFTQTRDISSFSGVGGLAGGRATFTSDDFSGLRLIDGVTVIDSATTGDDATISIEINDETFSISNLGDSIGAYEMIQLNSDKSSDYIRIYAGTSGAIDLSSASAAATFESALRQSFGMDGNTTGTLDFQIGSSSDDIISLNIGKATTDALFNGAASSLDITSTANAATAQTAIADAQEELNTIITSIGASQQRLEFSYNATDATITELDSAYSTLAETDVASESTAYAAYVVQQQAAIAVLAQSQALSSNLLDLLEAA